jgi:hypothetical protein
MFLRSSRALLVVLTLVGAGACSKSSALQPSASIGAPRPLQPVAGALVKNTDQPVTLIAQNATVTGSGSTTYTFEIGTDAAFASKVTKDGVAEGSGGQTGVKLDPLTAQKDYYWHVRAQTGGTTGVFSATSKFTIGPAITINAPMPLSPVNGAATGIRPTLVVANAQFQGPAGAITYRFEIATSVAFSPVVVTSPAVNEGSGQTSFIPTTDLNANQTYFWRATATDAANGVSSQASTVQSFVPSRTAQSDLAAQLGVPLWPGIQPTGTNGHAILGDNWQVQRLVSFQGVAFTSPPIEALQVFDLLDRGFSPPAAVDWMHSHGYPIAGLYYVVGAGIDVVGFENVYIHKNPDLGGQWDLTVRAGA